MEIYRCVRSLSRLPENSTCGDKEKSSDILISSLPNQAEQVVNGSISHFRHLLLDLIIDGIQIPELSIEVSKDSISFDYRMGKSWGEIQLKALFIFLRKLKEIAPKARIYHCDEACDEPTNDVFEKCFDFFIGVRGNLLHPLVEPSFATHPADFVCAG